MADPWRTHGGPMADPMADQVCGLWRSMHFCVFCRWCHRCLVLFGRRRHKRQSFCVCVPFAVPATAAAAAKAWAPNACAFVVAATVAAAPKAQVHRASVFVLQCWRGGGNKGAVIVYCCVPWLLLLLKLTSPRQQRPRHPMPVPLQLPSSLRRQQQHRVTVRVPLRSRSWQGRLSKHTP